jgi:RNA-splicing ligase RtcB
MQELRGKYNSCKVFTDNIDETTISQLINLMNQESIKDSQIRIMSDCHAGKGCVIGTTMTLHDKVIPNLVGVDIGCGMLAIKLKEHRIDLPAFDSVVYKYVPCGGNVHEFSNADRTSLNVRDLRCFGKENSKIREELAYASVGTLGGGNHFIEIDKDKDGALWLVIHTGSRNLGVTVCDYYQNAGFKALQDKVNGGSKKEKMDALIKELKAFGRQKEISKEVARFNKEYNEQRPNIPFELAYVEGELFEDYLHDMKMVQAYAKDNREEIARVLLKNAKLHEVERFDTIHNYIDVDNMILRKGSISARLGEKSAYSYEYARWFACLYWQGKS